MTIFEKVDHGWNVATGAAIVAGPFGARPALNADGDSVACSTRFGLVHDRPVQVQQVRHAFPPKFSGGYTGGVQ